MNPRESEVVQVPIGRIRILNPRVRDKKRFAEIVKNIETIGLKRPITLRIREESTGIEPEYEVVCGQGRLEAYAALGQPTVPAIIRGYDRKKALLAGLVENIARRRVRAIDQIQTIKWMKEQEHSPAAIAAKTGLAEGYIESILLLLDRGETRMLDAVLHGRMPITIASRIAKVPDDDAQQLLMQAYENGELKQRSLDKIRLILKMRQHAGRSYSQKDRSGRKRKLTAESFLTSYRQLATRQKLMIKKARASEARLLALTAAFRTLVNDDDFVHLLRAEKIGTLPKFLAERIRDPL